MPGTVIAVCWITAVAHAIGGEPRAAIVRETAPAAARATSRSVWDGVYTMEQARRGEAVYARECAHCHGQTLEGNGEGAGALAGIEFLSMWNGLTLGDMMDRVRLTMPLDKPGTLDRQQHADVLAYIVSANKFPAGKTELPREPERLKQILFDALKSGR
ncbi:MAG TPA: c-type cytochrome [Vicinamibacterales bacterium]|nr:c-type cytochrome [Vicinamibacterales bacterium]